MAAGYGELLRTPHAARLLIGTLLGRLPNATAALAVLLFARAEGGSYALAGGCRPSTAWPTRWASRCWAGPWTASARPG
ncbi:hypothetical protein SANT12839_024050 [Streptomyces antimycoticus]|uniref:Uncharacterized protein n=1 Tax=Streptomyces antimycoticus TaxID=68175 RepID=A0A4D4K6I2_9ACTN|nr:hypothetical protein SANT12839_024050 [Streptomyces antimycoticus]